MRNSVLTFYIKAQSIRQAIVDERGQDLVEYGLVLVLVCLAATAGMTTLANGINTAMTNISSKLATYTN